jgi:hypothetical protein
MLYTSCQGRHFFLKSLDRYAYKSGIASFIMISLVPPPLLPHPLLAPLLLSLRNPWNLEKLDPSPCGGQNTPCQVVKEVRPPNPPTSSLGTGMFSVYQLVVLVLEHENKDIIALRIHVYH